MLLRTDTQVRREVVLSVIRPRVKHTFHRVQNQLSEEIMIPRCTLETSRRREREKNIPRTSFRCLKSCVNRHSSLDACFVSSLAVCVCQHVNLEEISSSVHSAGCARFTQPMRDHFGAEKRVFEARCNRGRLWLKKNLSF